MQNGKRMVVLILVVMEEGQRHKVAVDIYGKIEYRLNPCCNGRGSKTGKEKMVIDHRMTGLNPCCNGRGSKTLL